MDDKNKWEIDRLTETKKDHEKRIGELEHFKTQTIERLKTLFNKIKNIESTNKFVSKTAFTLIAGGIITAIGALLNWILTR